ncbi:MAG: hypothetical protein GY950_31745, partial [bacterium]|nr:hypothetical protein [bacterium]
MIDQMPLPPETHYSQAIPVDMIRKKIIDRYPVPKDLPKPNVAYDYKSKTVTVNMTVVRSFFTPDWFTVPGGWKVKLKMVNIEEASDISHGFALTGHDIMESLDPGEVKDVDIEPHGDGVFWYYCLWFCSELHMEMRGRMIVIPENQWSPDKEWKQPST